MSNLQQYAADIIIDNTTGESFMSQAGLARVCKVDSTSIRHFANGEGFVSKEAETLTQQGLRMVKGYSEQVIAKAIRKFNPDLAEQLDLIGVRTLMHKLAGYEVKSTAVQPRTTSELILMLAQQGVETEARLTRLEAFAPLKDYYTITAYLNIEPNATKPAHYPSAGKALVTLSKERGVEVKTVPDSKYGKCNAYHVDVLNAYFF